MDNLAASGSNSKMFGPLSLNDNKSSHTDEETGCLLCNDSFNLDLGFELFVRHIFDVHSVVIEDVQNIEYLNEYITYWKEKFRKTEISSIIPAVSVSSTDKNYFLLSTLSKEDKELRHQLKLKWALKIQEMERTDSSYLKPCLFCKLQFEGTRHGFLEHLALQHNLHLGNPQNLVFLDELIGKIENNLKELKCLYCENIFPDRNVLKEHMRKKLHKMINPQNKAYDKYYIVNYLEVDKNWKVIEKEHDNYAIPAGSQENSDEEYADWNEKEVKITCLFCSNQENTIDLICLHMESEHDFDFEAITKNMDFYQRVKLINYVRTQTHNTRCLFCDNSFENLERLRIHLQEQNHNKIPDVKIFDQPEFYFPTYENDAFLYFLDDLD